MKRILSVMTSLIMMLSLVSPIYAQDSLTDEITGHYWYEGIQSISIISFNEDGTYTRYGMLGTPNVSNYDLNTISSSTVPTSEDLEAASQSSGTYTLENGTLTMDGNAMNLYSKSENAEISDENAQRIINNYNGNYYLYETNFEATFGPSQQAWYLLQMGPKDTSSTEESEISEESNAEVETDEEEDIVSKNKLLLHQDKLSASDWKSGYIECVNDLYNEYENYTFDLVRINDDKIPELVATGDNMYCSSHVFTYKKGKVYDLIIPYNGLGSYQKKENLLYCSSYRAGMAYDSVYSIGKKGFEFEINGVNYYDMTGTSDEMTYYIDGKEVKNESKYRKKIQKVYDEEDSSVKHFDSTLKTKDEVLEEIDNY